MIRDRIAKIDNIKFWVILSVVIGHVIFYFRGDPLADTIYLFVYSFHMPVMVFIAGMFSKHSVDSRRYEIVIQYLAVYLVMKFLEALADYFARGAFSFYFLWESGPAWFALALAVFILVTMFINTYDKKSMLLLAIMVGCLAGLDTHFGNHFASMRICVFYPVFLAGYYTEPEKLTVRRYDKKIQIAARIIALIVLILIFIVFFNFSDRTTLILQLFKGKHAYDEMGIGIEIIIYRLLCYAFWAAMGILVFLVVGERNTLLTWIGSRTMSVFIWHSFIISLLFSTFDGKEILLEYYPHLYLFAALVIAFSITVITAFFPDLRIADTLSVKGRRTDDQSRN
ncbi:MAG: acyltransferase family protein [Eubacterium sp.]|nr:acyltransferase family protein [Eubacterium sp.]